MCTRRYLIVKTIGSSKPRTNVRYHKHTTQDVVARKSHMSETERIASSDVCDDHASRHHLRLRIKINTSPT